METKGEKKKGKRTAGREKLIAVDSLLMTDKELCENHKISLATLYRTKTTDKYKQARRKAQQDIYAANIAKAQGYSTEALDTLREISKDTGATAGARVTACSKLLELAQSHYEQEAIVERIEKLEAANEKPENE